MGSLFNALQRAMNKLLHDICTQVYKLSMIRRHVLSDSSIAPTDEYNGCY